MTVKTCLERLTAISRRHVEQLQAGEITEAQANSEIEDIAFSARSEMTDEQFSEILSCVLVMHQTFANGLSMDGHPVPGNDPQKPN